MALALGIDTGGTYTDAALVDLASGNIIAGVKSRTTRNDLSIGIKEAIHASLGSIQKDSIHKSIRLVGLSTTLATNAIVEEKGAPVCLILIGYDRNLIHQYQFERDLVTDDVVYVSGGHDTKGNEVNPLDREAVREAVSKRRGRVGAFAVSGYFAVRNPTHELQVRKIVRDLSAAPVTCGHELSSRLDSIRRATTVTLNARLIPLLHDLISNVRRSLVELDIEAPLMVVKGDGSLVRAEWAVERPVETVLSGPAASAIGAFELTGIEDVWAVDVGGTTTDIIELKGGKPRVNPEGASIGGLRTMVEAVDVQTIGLGGDSHVCYDNNGDLQIGPRRVVPLCTLATESPCVLAELHRQAKIKSNLRESGQFLIGKPLSAQETSSPHADLSRLLADKPRSVSSLVAQLSQEDHWVHSRIKLLEETGWAQRAGFTPTDALHVIGSFQRWNPEASRLGAALLARRAGVTVEAFCEQLVKTVSRRLAVAVVNKVLEEESGVSGWAAHPAVKPILKRAFGDGVEDKLGCDLILKGPLVALGAPVEAYMPRVAEKLHTQLSIPHHADVANAVGAVSGGILQRFSVTIQNMNNGLAFRAFLPEGPVDFTDLEEAVTHASEMMTPIAEAQAKRAGAQQIEVEISRRDRRVRVGSGGREELHLDTELVFTAFGRPSPRQV